MRSRAGRIGPDNTIRLPLYIVSARLRGIGTATWLFDTPAFHGSTIGDIFPVNALAHRYSVWDSVDSMAKLAQYGITPAVEGYAASQACAR